MVCTNFHVFQCWFSTLHTWSCEFLKPLLVFLNETCCSMFFPRFNFSQYLCTKFYFFQSGNNRAFLFSHAMNIVEGPKEDRNLLTGLHTITDVFCSDCGELLGWKYLRAYEESQKYKEGKIILEKFKIIKDSWQHTEMAVNSSISCGHKLPHSSLCSSCAKN